MSTESVMSVVSVMRVVNMNRSPHHPYQKNVMTVAGVMSNVMVKVMNVMKMVHNMKIIRA